MVFEFEWEHGTQPNLAPALVMSAIETACRGVKITKWAIPDMRSTAPPKPKSQIRVICSECGEGQKEDRGTRWPARCIECGGQAAPKSWLRAMRMLPKKENK